MGAIRIAKAGRRLLSLPFNTIGLIKRQRVIGGPQVLSLEAITESNDPLSRDFL